MMLDRFVAEVTQGREVETITNRGMRYRLVKELPSLTKIQRRSLHIEDAHAYDTAVGAVIQERPDGSVSTWLHWTEKNLMDHWNALRR